MKKIYFVDIFILIMLFISGCTTLTEEPAQVEKTFFYKPLNPIQQEYYNVQTLFDAKKYRETIELGEEFVNNYKRDILAVAINYYIAASYQKVGNLDKAEKVYKQILQTNPNDEWGKLAAVGLEEIKQARK